MFQRKRDNLTAGWRLLANMPKICSRACFSQRKAWRTTKEFLNIYSQWRRQVTRRCKRRPQEIWGCVWWREEREAEERSGYLFLTETHSLLPVGRITHLRQLHHFKGKKLGKLVLCHKSQTTSNTDLILKSCKQQSQSILHTFLYLQP